MKAWFLKSGWWKLLIAAGFLAGYVLLLVWANSGWNGYTVTESTGIEYETARVLEVLEDNTEADSHVEGLLLGDTTLRLELLTGRYRGDIAVVPNYYSAMYNVDVREGDTVTVRIDTDGVGEYQVSIYNYDRTLLLGVFIAVFALALVLIGGKQGLRAFVGLVFTFVSVVFLLVPLTLRGYPSVPMTIALVAVTSVVCFLLLGGWQPKTIGAALGCLCGVCLAALFGYLASSLVHITTYQMDEAEALMLVQNENPMKMRGLFLCGVLIAALGAVMDIAMSVASAMDEVKEKRPDISGPELFRSGMRVGRDATGTMANTLILAVAGSSFNMMVLIYSYQVSFTQLVNTDFVAVELIRSIAGSLGIVMAVPCVAGITALLLTRTRPAVPPTPANPPAPTPKKGQKKRK